MTADHITGKLENIISGHQINADDAAWLRGLASAPAEGDSWPCPKCGVERSHFPACAQDGCQLMLNGLTEAETNETASVKGLIGQPQPKGTPAAVPMCSEQAVLHALTMARSETHQQGDAALWQAFGRAMWRQFNAMLPAAPSPAPAPKLPEEVAQSIAGMVTEWVDGGIRMGTNWRPGLADVIAKRLARFAAPAVTHGSDMLEPLIYAAMMHNGKPKTVAEFERVAANVADMLQRRAADAHEKPVASIYISADGSREFDDWRVDLPPGNHQLFTAPRPAQPQPESLPHPGAPEAEEMIDKLLADLSHSQGGQP